MSLKPTKNIAFVFKLLVIYLEFSKPLQKRIKTTEELTKDNTNLTQILALNYGGRGEITMAVNNINHNKVKKN